MFLAAIWLLIPVTATGAEEGQDTLLTPGKVVDLAARQSRAAVQAVSDTLAALANVRHARSTLYPTVDFQGQYITRDHQPEIAAGPLSLPMGNQSNGEFQLTARELLWNGGLRNLAITAARSNLAAARVTGLSRIQSTQLDALDRYVTALNLRGQEGVLDQSIASLEGHLKEVRDLYDQGLVARNDLLETRVRLDQVRDARAALDDNLAVILQDLNRILGREPSTLVVLPDSLPAALGASVPAAVDPDSLLRNNLQVKAASQIENTARTLGELARKAWYPNLFVAASHSWQDNDALVYPHVNSLALGVSWNIFDGGARSAETAKAEARILAAGRDRQEARRGARIALEQARRAMIRARREERTARANVAAARENLRIVEDQYRQGIARSSDVLDAEALLANSRLQVVIKHHQGFMARARLEAVTGRDLVSFYSSTENGKQGSVAP